jgi:hypothetical protein
MLDYSVFLIGGAALFYFIGELWFTYRGYTHTDFEPIKAMCNYEMYKKYYKRLP